MFNFTIKIYYFESDYSNRLFYIKFESIMKPGSQKTK